MHRHYCKACNKHVKHPVLGLCKRCYTLQTRFRVRAEDLEALRIAQDNCCKICGRRIPGNKALAVDHDHTTKRVRGLLCTRCNIGVGCFKTPELLALAITYLTSEHPTLRYLPNTIKREDQETIKLHLAAVLENENLTTLRMKARALATQTGLTEDGAMSRIRRALRAVSFRATKV